MRACFRRREIIVLSHADDNNKHPNFPYWKYAWLELEVLDNRKCLSDILVHKRVYREPEGIIEMEGKLS